MLPPAPAWPRSEAAILAERTGSVGVALWQFARDIRLWAQTDSSNRRGLFRVATNGVWHEAVVEAPQLARSFEQFSALIRSPDQQSAADVAGAATEIARWAEEAHLLQTALEFAEAAALAEPSSSPAASLAGRLARRVGENGRSAAWYRRAIGLARGDHDAYIRAQLGYGGVMVQIGNYGSAKLAFRRASRLAVKYGRRGFAAQANHELLLIAGRRGTYEEGEAAVVKAVERYPLRHPRLPDLAYDYAYLLMRNLYFSAAIPILVQLMDMVRHQARVVVCGSLARCAGAIGDRELFESSSKAVLNSLPQTDWHAARALVEVAAGAKSLGDFETALRLAGDALEIAQRITNDQVEGESRELLRELGSRAGGDVAVARDAPVAVQLTVAAFLRKLAKRGGQNFES